MFGCLSAVLDFKFFTQFVFPFLPLTFVEVDVWLSFFLFAVFLPTFFISFIKVYCIQVVFNFFCLYDSLLISLSN